jgi:hypothetical protein
MRLAIHNEHEASYCYEDGSEDLYRFCDIAKDATVTFDYGSDEESACVVRKNQNGVWAIGGFSSPVPDEVQDWLNQKI